ncbi:PREDICTED: short-chain dehydrogenase/reductase family 16C member 6-like [Polistes dominula]|uniref:Short-chain dehydrogenase/reductase family 16C member 6-like n=1 Tax=Polistes dominula TaxID=743375 RepID=A0ABM1J4B3_POLDO|nr:PREDICTED: short-chain dehydrogenase/reductase family 16C member 6-like [Polistes dominula]XP_015187300.1 PREDICTED: short-chain dehydrogenase/reductase family 16C member 6-like [Polistes dominula]XP_015187301.1 PREDICTED: short-chain dehydrogenase/reductase family 16C member 6-like [Polistes dominula]
MNWLNLLSSIYETICFLVSCAKIIIEGIVRACIPVKFQMKDIQGEIALVTGGGGGLGRLLALRLANLGVIVVVWDINQEGIEETVKLVQAAGGTCYGYVCDLCNREDIYKKAALLREEVGKVSILINNAGVVNGMKFCETPDYLLKRTMDVNIMSHFWTVKAFLPAMMESNKGHIVSIASMAGYAGIPKLVDYCTSKHAVLGFDEGLRIELEYEGYDNINTTAICPYFIRSTAMFGNRYYGSLPQLSPNEVAETTITSLRCNRKLVMIPSYFQFFVPFKWIFPWPCTSKLFRTMVKDILPDYEKNDKSTDNNKTTEIPVKDQDDSAIHQQLTRHSSCSEREP